MATKRDHLSTVQSELRGQGLTIADADIYAGPLNDSMEDACIFMTSQTSPPPDDTFGIGGSAIQHPSVQVRIRNPDRTAGKSDADSVWELMQNADLADYGPTRMPQSSPIFIGTDGDERYEWSVNAELWIYE